MQAGEEWVTYKVRIARMMRIEWKKMGLSSLAELCAEKFWKTLAWAVYEGEVLVLNGFRSVIGWRTTAWWRNRSARGMKMDPVNVTCCQHKWGFHDRGGTWSTLVAKLAGSEEDWRLKGGDRVLRGRQR